MRTRSKLVLAGLIAALVLAAAVLTASASRFVPTDQDFRLQWAALTFRADVGEAVMCEVSLTGSFHSGTLSKVLRALVGAMTSVARGDCEGGSVTILSETLPWHMLYNGFTGTLPEITGVRLLLVGASFRVQTSATCLARTDPTEPSGGTANVSGTSGLLTDFRIDESLQIDLDSPDFACNLAGDSNVSGSARISRAPSGLMFVNLI